MKIEYYEKVFLWLSTLVLVAGLGAIAASVFAADIHLPGDAGRVDPRTVRQTPPFDQPGVVDRGNGEVEVVMLAQTWLFTPSEVRVPVGSKVTFRITSPDVTHGFLIENTDINAMAVPGQITEVTYTFKEPGEHLIICHEYCGIGHHGMYGRVVVE
jgi:cytochrome c oxidase subunit 2